MKELSGKGRILCFDMEAIGFIGDMKERQEDAIHIIRVKDEITDERWHFFDDYEDRINKVHLGKVEEMKAGNIADGLRFMKTAKCLISQNGLGYDFMVFRKIYPDIWKGINYTQATDNPTYPIFAMDTMVMSQVLNPERRVPFQCYAICKDLGMKIPGPHSIAAHGMRIGRFKPDHEDWSKLTLDMFHRVDEDVEIGSDFYDYLKFGDDGWNHQCKKRDVTKAYLCELRLCQAVANQSKRGFRIHTGKLIARCEEIDEETIATDKAFRPHMPMRMVKSKISPAKQDAYVNKLAQYLSPLQMIEMQRALNACEWRVPSKTTKWDIINKDGSYKKKEVTAQYPSARGYITDFKSPLVAGPFTPIDWEEIPLGNRDLVKQVLHEQGWLGINFNDTELKHIEDTGEIPKPWSGKIDEKSISMWKYRAAKAHGFDDSEECEGELDLYVKKHKLVPEWAQGIARWYVLSSRRGQMLNAKDVEAYNEKGQWNRQQNGKRECRGLLPKCFDPVTGITQQDFYEENGHWCTDPNREWRIPANAFACATNTFRMKHRNVVNIPSRGLYPLRDLFIAGKGKVVIGCDAAGLELRMLAHFMNDPVYMDVILNGDIHTYNQNMAGLPIRDMAKTFIYAFLYGSGIPNLARVCGVSESEMRSKVDLFKSNLPALANLLERVEAVAAQGFLMCVDGRRGRIRSSNGKLSLHTALNVLLQMTGSVVMKWGHIIAEDLAVEKGYIEDYQDFPMIAHQHDEAQMEGDEDLVEWMEFTCTKSEWKTVEKEPYIDASGRQWSAPRILSKDGDTFNCRRGYHPIGEAYADGIRLAGIELGLRCPTAGEYMIGDSWADTH